MPYFWRDVTIATGQEPEKQFAPSGQSGDWQSFEISFPVEFPGPPVIMATPSFSSPHDFDDFDHKSALPVPVVAIGATGRQATILARNAGIQAGKAGMTWLAAYRGPPKVPAPDVVTGRLSTVTFGDFNAAGDWLGWDAPSRGVGVPRILATAMCPAGAPLAVPVGISHRPRTLADAVYQGKAFGFHALNRHVHGGVASFGWLAVSEGQPLRENDLRIESGSLESVELKPSNERANHVELDIFFEEPFASPPVVLVTAKAWFKIQIEVDPRPRAVLVHPHPGAPIPVLREVTPYGARVLIVNSDSATGLSGFDWLAAGCGHGC